LKCKEVDLIDARTTSGHCFSQRRGIINCWQTVLSYQTDFAVVTSRRHAVGWSCRPVVAGRQL
jgi:hypothetical protein